MKVKTLESDQVWQSPDGEKKIWSVQLQADDGNKYRLQTFSEAIATKDFEGDVETYNKGDKKFVKQVQQESGYRGGRGGGNNSAERLALDTAKQKEIRAEWAIGKAIQANQMFPLDKQALEATLKTATQLYAMVDDVINAAGVPA